MNDIQWIGQAGSAATTYLVPGQSNFNKPEITLPSNSRTVQMGAKVIF